MTEAERASSLEKLDRSREILRQAVAGITEEQARFKPGPASWSIEEIVEHLAVSEHGMYRLISEIHEASDDPREEESAASMARTGDRVTRPLSAPERALPKARFASLKEALDKFLDNRSRTIDFVKNCEADLTRRLIRHPAGLVNGRDCLTILTNHPIRHAAQIAEVKAHAAYPR